MATEKNSRDRAFEGHGVIRPIRRRIYGCSVCGLKSRWESIEQVRVHKAAKHPQEAK